MKDMDKTATEAWLETQEPRIPQIVTMNEDAYILVPEYTKGILVFRGNEQYKIILPLITTKI